MGLIEGAPSKSFRTKTYPVFASPGRMRSWACFRCGGHAFELKVLGQRVLTIRRNHGCKPTSALGKVNGLDPARFAKFPTPVQWRQVALQAECAQVDGGQFGTSNCLTGTAGLPWYVKPSCIKLADTPTWLRFCCLRPRSNVLRCRPSANHATCTDGGGACNACLGCNDSRLSNHHVVGHLNEVVEFAASAKDGASQGGRSMVVNAPTSQWSSMTTFPVCGTLA